MGNHCNAQVKAHSSTPSATNNSGMKGTVEGILSNRKGNVDVACLSKNSNLHSFSFSSLKAATRNFRSDGLLGRGGFGSVFKGWIDENALTAARPGTGMVIAVKMLNLEGLQGHREWMAEVKFLGQLHHPNLVKLIGFCAEDDHRLLVYEFMPCGSLENHLFSKGHTPSLPWDIRIKIVLGAARGVAFLHNAERPVIYRDFKSSNILLDSQYNAKLSDFGLAKDGPIGDDTHVSTRLFGTNGYAAPEYVATGHLTPRSDIYSFGVVLLEILTGYRAVDNNRLDGKQNLVEWVKPFLSDKRKLYRIIDSRLEGQYSMKGAHKLATLALSCVNTEARLRPLMKDIVEALEPLLTSREMAMHGKQTPSNAHAVKSQQKKSLDFQSPRN